MCGDFIGIRSSRRQVLGQMLGAAGIAPLLLPSPMVGQKTNPTAPLQISPEDDQFLDDLERANFLFFWEQANPETGLIKDRCNVRVSDKGKVSSIAATGFGLTALCIGHKRGYGSSSDIRNRVLATMRFLYRKMPNHRGFYYHFADIETGARVWDSEISSVDTAILLCGVLMCRKYFPESEISKLAFEIFSRADWTWLSADTTLLPHGWTPEGGFLPYRWDYYSELMMMYLMGLGSSSYPLPIATWNSWKRTTFEYDGLRYVGSFAPLFVHQYSQAWFDFRGKRDQYADYFQNSITATEVHRRFCLELAAEFPTYAEDMWGITASDSKNGYAIWGGPPQMGAIDGTVAPAAAGGSLPFLPDATLRVLKNIKNKYGQTAWNRYGFINAFNPLTKWTGTDVIGIDTGITMLMAENLRTGFVWDIFMKNSEAKRGLERAGFKPYP